MRPVVQGRKPAQGVEHDASGKSGGIEACFEQQALVRASLGAAAPFHYQALAIVRFKLGNMIDCKHLCGHAGADHGRDAMPVCRFVDRGMVRFQRVTFEAGAFDDGDPSLPRPITATRRLLIRLSRGAAALKPIGTH